MEGLQRRFGFTTTVAVIIGGMIGSGIFMKPALMASQLGSPSLLLSVWVVAGLFTLLGAMSNAELASLYPETGGSYVYLRKIYGEGVAFLYGWSAFAVFNTAGTVSIAYVLAHYAGAFIDLPRLPEATVRSVVLHLPGIGRIFPLENMGEKALTTLVLFALTALNYFSASMGGALQRVLSALKVIAIGVLVLGILFGGSGSEHGMFDAKAHVPAGWALLGAYVAALSGAFWAYDGWNNITFIAGEVKDPQRNIPRGLLVGVCSCVLIYLLVNMAYLHVLSIGAMASSGVVAADAASMVWGAVGGGLVAAMVMLSTLGATSANVLATARVTYSWSADLRRYTWAGKVREGSRTPGNALLLNLLWMCVLVFSGSFDMLTDMLIFVSWLFYGMLALGVIILRRRMKDVPRPYKVPGFPWVPGLFALFTAMFLIITLYTDISNYTGGRTPIINSLLGLAITAIGIPLYYWMRKRPQQ